MCLTFTLLASIIFWIFVAIDGTGLNNISTKNYYVWQKTWRDAYNSRDFGGLVTNDFTVLLNQIPFKWKGLSNEYEMMFIGGLFGLDFDDAYQYVAAELEKAEIVSFDKDFDQTEKGRLTPIQVLKLKS